MKIKRLIWEFFSWSILLLSVINLIMNWDTWVRWKWGWFSIDAIPPILTILFLYFVNQNLWISRINKELQELKIKQNEEKNDNDLKDLIKQIVKETK